MAGGDGHDIMNAKREAWCVDTKQFLDAVLPLEGRRCVGVLQNRQFSNYFGKSNEWAANAIERIDAHKADAYFACATFSEDQRSRRQDNVHAVRSFWLDIDTQEGKPGERYANRKEALGEALQFAQEIGWPTPYVVSSGYGIHLYWPTTEDIHPDSWKLTADLLKTATKMAQLAVDHSRTSDSASVLRPVGAHNYKREAPRQVKLLMVGATTPHAELHLALERYTGETASADLLGEAPSYITGDNSDLMVERTFAPSSAVEAAKKCAALAEMRDSGGNIPEPYWHSMLGVIVNSIEGDELAHEWSKGHPQYNRRDTQTRLDRLRSFGPTTCQKISDYSPHCMNCPLFGTIGSPITLGVQREMVSVITEAVIEDPDDPDAPVERVVFPDMPDGYFYGIHKTLSDKPVLYRIEKVPTPDDQGNVTMVDVPHQVADIMFFPVARVRSTDDLHSMNLKIVGDNINRDFLLDNGLITSGDKQLYAELGRREIGMTNKTKPELNRYLNAWIGKLREDYAATPCIEQYGWHDEGFVLGTSYITSSGERKAILNSSAAKFGDYFKAQGELDVWVDAVDRAYNHPGQEGLQFCVLLSFAAPLWPLFGDNGGCTVYAHSAGSGYGKTTAQQVGLSAWGYYPELVLRESNFTEGALYQHIGVMKNLPVVIDEMTNCSNDFASKLVYNMSAGKGKSRLTSDAVMKKPLNWSTIAAASGNNLLTEKLSLHRANAEAEMARVWEFTLTKKGTLDPNAALELFGTFTQHYGHAGRAFMQYVVENRDEVVQLLLRMRQMFNTQHGIQQSERYWSALHACVLTALAICKKLKLLRFSSEAMMNWIGVELLNNRGQMQGSVSDPLEQFGDMLSDIWSGVLVTVGEGNLAAGVQAQVIGHPRTSITGRSILADQTSAEKLFVSTGAAKAWCNRHGVSFKEMHEALVNAGWADTMVKRISLGKGTEQYSGLGGPVKCWDINPSAVRTVMGSRPVAQKVHAVITGSGKDVGVGTRNRGAAD